MEFKMNEDKRYCVYVHKDSDGNIRYVGSGTELRATLTYSNSNKSQKYAKYVDQYGKLFPEILANNLTLMHAREQEYALYLKYVGTGLLLNVRKPTKEYELIKDHIDKFLEYDENSPSFLTWKVDVYKGRKQSQIQIRKGTHAGWLDKSGYYKVSINSNNVQAHRVVACLNGFDVNGNLVDHINGVKVDNRKENLRVVDFKQNSRNRKVANNSTTGISGVGYKATGNYSRYYYQWTDNDGFRRFKSFNVGNRNKDDVLAELLIFRKEILRSLGDYSDDHGVRNGI